MSRSNYLSFTVKRNLAVSATIFFISATLLLGVTIFSNNGANAMTSSSNDPVPAYTGGAPVANVFYPADGSTMTITCTGAVIKQSPGGNPYRNGWVNPSNIGSIHSVADLKGRIASGSSNPYGDSNICPTNQSNNNPTPQTFTQASANNQQPTQPVATTTSSTPTPQAPTSSSTPAASSTANATANANVTLTGSSVPAKDSSAATAVSTTPARTSQNNSGKGLPNTGPGNALALSGAVTVLGTMGHLIYQRLRYRSVI